MSPFVATITELSVTATQAAPDAPFTVTVTRNRSEWRENGTHRSTTDTVGEEAFDAPLPIVFAAVNDWLLDRFRAAVLPRSWKVDAHDGLTLSGEAVPATRPSVGPIPPSEQAESLPSSRLAGAATPAA